MENKNVNSINEERFFKVYMHTSPNGKRYIGITRQENPERRWGSNGCGYIDNKHFWRAIQKHGWNNFLHEVLFEGLTKEEAEEKEKELIAYYDSTDQTKGYNVTAGGGYNINAVLRPIKQYTIDGVFIKEYECIKYASFETGVGKSSISLCCNKKLKTAGGYIWQFSDVELTEEHIAWCNSDKRSENCVAVHKYSMSGEFIQEYESMTIAALENDTSLTSILLCCKGEYKTVANSIWRYAWEELTQEHLEWCNTLSSDSLKKKINQYLKDGTFVCTYESIGDANLKTGVSRCGIGSCCRGESKTAGNFLWRFFDDEITDEYIKWCNSIETFKGKREKTGVIQYTIDGVFVAIYDSLNKAEKATGISHHSISSACKSDTGYAKGFIWRYASEIQDPYAPLFPTTPTLQQAI